MKDRVSRVEKDNACITSGGFPIRGYPSARKIISSRSHEEATLESFRKDPEFAAEYLNSILENGDQEDLMLAYAEWPRLSTAYKKLAGKSNLNANTLHRTYRRKEIQN